MSKPLRVFISHPLHGRKVANVRRAVLNAAYAVRERGHFPFVPHIGSMDLLAGQEIGGEDEDYFLTYEHHVWGWIGSWLHECDALLVLGNWWESRGCKIELCMASRWRLPVYWTAQQLPKVEHQVPDFVMPIMNDYEGE